MIRVYVKFIFTCYELGWIILCLGLFSVNVLLTSVMFIIFFFGRLQPHMPVVWERYMKTLILCVLQIYHTWKRTPTCAIDKHSRAQFQVFPGRAWREVPGGTLTLPVVFVYSAGWPTTATRQHPAQSFHLEYEDWGNCDNSRSILLGALSSL